MRSFLPSPSESKSVSTQTSPLIQSAVLVLNTFWARPSLNVGTAGAGSGAGAAMTASGAAAAFGGSGFAFALLTPTTPAKATVAVIAPALARRLPISIRDPSLGPGTLSVESVRVGGAWQSRVCRDVSTLADDI